MAKIIKRIPKQQQNRGTIEISSHSVWGIDEIAKVIKEADVHNGVIKIDIVHGVKLRNKQSYIVQIYHWPKLKN